MLYRLFYVSHAVGDMDDQTVDALADYASTNNQKNEIVGALCFNGRQFGQMLEGPQDAIFKLLDKIRADERHRDMIIVGEKTIRRRYFKDFHMKRVRGMDFDDLITAMASE
ncbi:MAG: BLUF domain-containing protein [Salaquimonas sp.]